MIRITIALDMPAGHADLAQFSTLLDEHDMPPAAFQLAGASTPDRLVAVKELDTAPLPAATPAQVVAAQAAAPASKPRTTPSRAPKAPTAARAPRSGGIDVTGAVTRVLEARGGRFAGSYTQLAELAHPDNPKSGIATIRQMVQKGKLTVIQHGRKVESIQLPEALGPVAAPAAPPASTPDPAELATGPITRAAFDPDKARAGAALAL